LIKSPLIRILSSSAAFDATAFMLTRQAFLLRCVTHTRWSSLLLLLLTAASRFSAVCLRFWAFSVLGAMVMMQ
jgi:hypothetical protein